MAAYHPVLKFTEDAIVYIAENLLADDRPMKHHPTVDLRVELSQEFIHWRVEILSEGSLDLGEKNLHILARRLGDQLTAVLLNVFAGKVETIFNVRDAGFALWDLHAWFFEEFHCQRSDFFLQQSFRPAGNDEVVCKTHKIDQTSAPLREVFCQQRL